ncbi:GMC family oxidoreductase [Rhodococcus sp. IEGM 1381]|uniref:GMC oxidoreductase n=1 Tax=Rhodococcus sp. IEGM 1381 TaxID=3047085 RepID=UPI0024B7AC9B|nr:GMC family oxidoreductase [Rhodococcus sp. IEGM 1381]MDI9893163.1 GMC family oxidoreductase [Rhodococcus sp. IEGM 1381]
MTLTSRPIDRYAPLRDGAVVDASGIDTVTADVVVVGSGMGGSTLAYALRESGLDVLVVERGKFLPREPENSMPEEMHIHGRYKTAEPWFDARTGEPFHPGTYYWVGGNTKFYGASLPRFRRQDFGEIIHHDGTSPAWPFTYDDLEPFYVQAEKLFQVHGTTDEDPTEPVHSEPYPHPPLEHEPTIERFADSLKKQGLHPFHTPNGMNLDTEAQRRASTASDGTPSESDVKSEAENRVLRPALEAKNVRLLIEAKITRLLTSTDGRTIVAAEADLHGRAIRIEAKQFVVSAGAVNSAALLLRSATDQHPDGLGNSSGLLGRNYMVHNSTFFIGIDPRRKNTTAWQKTLGLNDWYAAGPDNEYPLGNLQMLGKLQGAMIKSARSWAPMWALEMATQRSLDIYLTTEDLPRLDSQVTVSGDKIFVNWRPNNVEPHRELVERVTKAVRKAGYPIVLTQRMGIETNSHMCGTAVAGHDPSRSVLDANCRSHDVENLWMVDGSFFPSSAALNPALTIAANALRVAPSIVAATH